MPGPGYERHQNDEPEGAEAPIEAPDVTATDPEASGLPPVPEVQEEYEPTADDVAAFSGALEVEEEKADEAPEPPTWCELEEMLGYVWMRDRNAMSNRSVHFLNAVRLRIKELAKEERTAAML